MLAYECSGRGRRLAPGAPPDRSLVLSGCFACLKIREMLRFQLNDRDFPGIKTHPLDMHAHMHLKANCLMADSTSSVMHSNSLIVIFPPPLS